MKKLFPFIVAVICATGCFSGSKGDNYIINPDLKIIPVEIDDEMTYLDLSSGKKAENAKKYESAGYFYNGVAVITTEDGCQLVDKDFKPIHKGTFSQATLLNDGIAYVVEPAGHIVAMDKAGKVVFTLDNAEEAYAFHDGVSVFTDEDGHYGLVNTSGQVLIEPEYSDLSPFGNNGLIFAAKETKSGEKWGVIDYNNQEIIPFEYDGYWGQVESFSALKNKNFYMVSKGKVVIVNAKNEELLPDGYEGGFLQSDGNFYVVEKTKRGERFGWLDKKGNELIEAEFSEAMPFTYCKVTLAADPTEDDQFGLINKKGEWVVEPKFEAANTFTDDKLAIVSNSSDQYGAINEKGEFVIKAKYDRLYYLGDGLYIARRDGAEGILDSKGETVVAISDKYDFDTPSPSGDPYSVSSEYVNVSGVVDKMMDEYKMLSSSSPSKSFYEEQFGVDLDGYGWKTMKSDSESNKNFSVYHSAYADYDYEYTFYGNYDTVRYLTRLKLDFDLKGKAYRVRNLIFNELANRLGASCKMDKDGNITGDTTFTPKGISGCSATIDSNFDIYITPESGRIQ